MACQPRWMSACRACSRRAAMAAFSSGVNAGSLLGEGLGTAELALLGSLVDDAHVVRAHLAVGRDVRQSAVAVHCLRAPGILVQLLSIGRRSEAALDELNLGPALPRDVQDDVVHAEQRRGIQR